MQFRIQALTADGSVLTQMVEANDAETARLQVAAEGLQVLAVHAVRALRLRRGDSPRFPLLLFSQELLALLNAGISLVEAIETLVEKEQRPDARKVLRQVLTRLREGLPLSRAVHEWPAAFPPLFCATVQASERTGGLCEALTRYVAYQIQLESVRKKLVGAAIYPAVLLGVGLLVIAFLLFYVVPRFSHVYADMGENLPWLSRVLLAWGQFFEEHMVMALAALAAVGLALRHAIRQPPVQRRLRELFWSFPALGERMRTYQLARFYRTLGMLLRGGMPVAPSIQMVANLLHTGMRSGLDAALVSIREGRSISQAMERHGLVTPVALRMLRVGERTGAMGEMMEKIAEFHDEEMARWVEWFGKLFEPVLMAVIGVLIGVIVLLMYLPIFELAGSIQ